MRKDENILKAKKGRVKNLPLLPSGEDIAL
jgi:hypothetical protein